MYSYLDGKYKANRLIVQLESLFKIPKNDYSEDGIKIPKYNWIIIDKIESILNHFMSTTFKGNEKFLFNLLVKLCEHADKIITLDGDWSNRAFKFLQ